MRHCVNRQTGDITHWPFPGKDWAYNARILTALQTVWKAWRFCSIPTDRYTSEDVDYLDWISNDDDG